MKMENTARYSNKRYRIPCASIDFLLPGRCLKNAFGRLCVILREIFDLNKEAGRLR